MEIRKRGKNYRHRLSVGALVLCLLVLSMTTNVRNVWADPHGMFYTAIGQQQLFFNVLAALDQADYVETSLDREARRQSREAVEAEPQFTKETESGGRFTGETEIALDTAGDSANSPSQPGTPALLNRQVTLEGADLYTDQLVREFGAESARRNSLSELLRTLCDFGLGFKNCGYSLANDLPGTAVEREVYRTNTLVTDPLEWANWPFRYGVYGALFSNRLERFIPNPDPYQRNPARPSEIQPLLNDYEYRQGKWKYPEIFGTEPYAYSPEIADMNQYIRGLLAANAPGTLGYSSGEYLQAIFNSVIGTVIDQRQGNPQVATLPYKHITGADGYLCLIENPNTGVLSLDTTSGLCATDIPSWMDVKDYISWVSNARDNLYFFIDNIASNAADRVSIQQEMIENEGVLADVQLKSSALGLYSPDPEFLGHPGELSAYILSPKAARTASIYGIPNALATMDASQLASALTGLDVPGSKQLVYRPGESGNTQSQCNNGIDDDGDARVDYPQDSQCTSSLDNSESQDGTQSASLSQDTQVAEIGSEGRVAGILGTGAGNPILDLFNPQQYTEYDAQKDPTSPSANLISPHLEQGAAHSLRGLTGGDFRSAAESFVTCGITCP